MKKQIGQVIIFAFLFIISYQFLENPYSANYMEEWKTEAAFTTGSENSLLKSIKEKAESYEEKPIDAVIDRVWKAIPGYNGIKVDIQQSYKNMKKEGRFNEKKLVFKEVTPKVSLDDLEPSPIYKGNPKKEMVSFQINVAWGNEFIPEILKTLKKHDVKATFFLDGSWTKKNPRLAKMLVEEGHEIGNHAYSHPDLRRSSAKKIREEIQMTNEIIEATIDKTPKWFAPPSGSFNDNVVKIAHGFHMKTVLWTVDTVDWKSPNPDVMANNIIQKVHPGAMILMHPTESTAAGLEKMINGIEEKGLKIGTVSELLSEQRLPKID
ncbi:hypothetical protein DCC39_01265 [Pueribacillus theae]|uniref:NodB homology domain-containing protein n=1 Tax=Pueribacillus theae TaxID=2171751 RepID=A0A2U1K7N8_9BACI|nr:polysaccharide deacetylase family protein [Pueribacillus theae]PWA13551.1 hypothetical protein DCC39_01265 [Pueribacillus theae]